MAEILYGVREEDGKIISISDILSLPDPDVMRGKKCGCVCPHPGCGRPLDAKLGCGIENGGKEPHFAHRSGFCGSCDIAYANESALHMMAKEIIAEEFKFAAPDVKITWEDVDVKDIPVEVFDEVPVYIAQKGGTFPCHNVVLEQRITGIVPDVVASTDMGEYLIEIFVTHSVTNEKKLRATELQLPMIEIDLSDYRDKAVTRDDLRAILMKPSRRMRWIYYKGKEESLLKAQDYYRNHKKVLAYFEEEKKREADRQKRCEDAAREKQKREAARERANNYFSALLRPENYASSLSKLRNDQAFFDRARSFKFYSPGMNVPFFIDIPITGEMVFQCDRRIWQGIIFNRWVFNRKDKVSYIPICPQDKNWKGMFDRLMEEENVPVDKKLLYKFSVEAFGRTTFFPRRDVIFKYIKYLKELGFISDIHNEWSTLTGAWTACTHSIVPPSKEYADKLQQVLQQVNLNAPNIDELIERALDPHKEQRRQEKQKALREEQEAKQREEQERYIAAQEKADADRRAAETQAAEQYRLGKEEVKNRDFSAGDLIFDRFGKRWLLCTTCNEVYYEADMPSHYAAVGTCRNCLMLRDLEFKK